VLCDELSSTVLTPRSLAATGFRLRHHGDFD
jgi:hypothetical protein